MTDQETQAPPSRYRNTYRDAEVRLICNAMLRGDSLGFVGVAGVGKSNLINFLAHNSTAKASYLGAAASHALFPVVDITAWDRTAIGLWNIMLRALSAAAPDIPLPDEGTVRQLIPEQRQLLRLQQYLKRICQELAHRVMFILDDCDPLFETGPLSMIEELSRLRNEGNRNMLSYLVFTKRLPHVLGRKFNLAQESKFYDFIRHSLYALEPYCSEDALQMLQHLNERAGKPLRRQDLPVLYTLAGGHGQLLRTIFDVRVQTGPLGPGAVDYLAAQGDVYQECLRIFLYLHPEEQEAALLFARNEDGPEHAATIRHLARRGLLSESTPPVWFSPVMQRWLVLYPGVTPA